MDRERIRKLLAKSVPGIDANLPFGNQLDSLQLAELANLLEVEFGIEIKSIEVNEENFNNLHSVEKLIAGKLKSHDA